MTRDQLAPFYRDRSVLVTGGASFIGSHLCGFLHSHGARIRVVDDLSTGRLGYLSPLPDLDVQVADLRDPEVARAATEGVEIVFHLAARHGGREYVDAHPVECIGNALLDHVVFQAATANAVRCVVFASSACVYPVDAPGALPDRHAWREPEAGFDQPGAAFADGEYGWAKLYGELQLHAFHRSAGLDVAVCRLFNVYGLRENRSHAIVALLERALAREDPFVIWGDGTQERCFTHVDDVVRALALAGRCRGFNVFNIASNVATTINQLAERIFEAVGWHPDVIEHRPNAPVGASSRVADISHAGRSLGWLPVVRLDDGIAELISDRSGAASDAV